MAFDAPVPDAWETTPAVDPWADQDTPWQPASAVTPEATTLPPTATLPTIPQVAPPSPDAPHSPDAPPQTTPRLARRPPARKAPPPRPRRRRGWSRTLLLFSLFSVACCCGVPGYVAMPMARQYPASAVLPSAVSDLRLHEDAVSRRAADRLAEQLADVDLVADDVFAGVYGDGTGKRVTLFGMTGFLLTPGSDLDVEMRHLAERYAITGVQPFDLDEAGAHERCGVGRSAGDPVVVCGWADHGSLGTAVLTRRSMAESADLVRLIRESVLTRG